MCNNTYCWKSDHQIKGRNMEYNFYNFGLGCMLIDAQTQIRKNKEKASTLCNNKKQEIK